MRKFQLHLEVRREMQQSECQENKLLLLLLKKKENGYREKHFCIESIL